MVRQKALNCVKFNAASLQPFCTLKICVIYNILFFNNL